MKKYKIGVWEETGGYYFITAETEEQARKKAEEMLYDSIEMHKVNHGDRGVITSDLIEE